MKRATSSGLGLPSTRANMTRASGWWRVAQRSKRTRKACAPGASLTHSCSMPLCWSINRPAREG
jgi:hypothetical protein